MDDAVLRNAILRGVEFTKASLYDVDASGACLIAARLMGASFLDTDLRGADLTDATADDNSFRVRLDNATVVTGFTGTIFGPVECVGEDGEMREIGGRDLEQWMRERGASIRVLSRTT
jgi:uncharacterized protein YjbI with pentapeptide repeats